MPPDLTTSGPAAFFSQKWEDRLAFIVPLMRELSRQSEAQGVVEYYGTRMQQIIGYDAFISLSRRDLVSPHVRITRSSRWTEDVNPWKEKSKLPLLDGGLLSELIYKEEPTVIDELHIDPSDPAAEYFAGMHSLFAIPMFDKGKSLNMIVTMSTRKAYYPREHVPEMVWLSNLFGRSTQTLVLSEELQRAYNVVDRELQAVADIQRSLLPQELPSIPTLEMGVHYSTSQQAGGDYYDFFPMSDGRWGILIADVSGHGTPAAVLMAVTHSIAHTFPGQAKRPGEMLNFLNQQLAAHYTNGNGTFVTAFYGLYDPKTHRIDYACAGHGPPRIKSCKDGALRSMDRAYNLPLGIDPDETYDDQIETTLEPGDAIVFYTDGITETRNATGELFGVERLDAVLTSCNCDPETVVRKMMDAVNAFGNHLPATDDRTLLVARISA